MAYMTNEDGRVILPGDDGSTHDVTSNPHLAEAAREAEELPGPNGQQGDFLADKD